MFVLNFRSGMSNLFSIFFSEIWAGRLEGGVHTDPGEERLTLKGKKYRVTLEITCAYYKKFSESQSKWENNFLVSKILTHVYEISKRMAFSLSFFRSLSSLQRLPRA